MFEIKNIFISYKGKGSADYANLLYDYLSEYFTVFFDDSNYQKSQLHILIFVSNLFSKNDKESIPEKVTASIYKIPFIPIFIDYEENDLNLSNKFKLDTSYFVMYVSNHIDRIMSSDEIEDRWNNEVWINSDNQKFKIMIQVYKNIFVDKKTFSKKINIGQAVLFHWLSKRNSSLREKHKTKICQIFKLSESVWNDIFLNQKDFKESLSTYEIHSNALHLNYSQIYSIPTPKKVNFSIFTPSKILKGDIFQLHVWAYLKQQYNEVLESSKEIGCNNVRGKKEGVPLDRETNILITLQIDSMEIEDSSEIIFWDGSQINASFIVSIPPKTNLKQHIGKALITHHGILIAKINFLINVEDNSIKEHYTLSQKTLYPKSAFASYSSKDRKKVLHCIQGIKQVAPDLEIFIDKLSLKAGDNWEKILKENIWNKDVFYLFWSQFSLKSEWVEKEWKMALRERGLEYIHPIPLEDIHLAPPPNELNQLHFSDIYSIIINSET